MPEIKQDIRSRTFVVATDDSLHKNMADYVCNAVSAQVEINAALNALPAQGGGVILLGGTYNIDAPIIIPANNITLRGQGCSTLIDGDGLATGEHAIVISAVTSCTIKKLAIQTEDGGGKTCHCIYISDGANSFEIEYVTFVDSDSDSIRIAGATTFDGSIHNCHFNDADDYGIYCDPTGDMLRIHIRDNFITGCGFDGIRVYNIDYGLVEGNTVYLNGQNGIYILNSDYATVADNICVSNGISGIYTLGVTNSTVGDNLCYLNTDVNIHIGGTSDHNVVEGNQCVAAVSDTSDGIQIDGTANQNTINGNACIGNGRHGIYCWGSLNAITGNHCCINGQHGIHIAQVECQINNNYLYLNSQSAAGTSHGINLSGAADRCQVNDNYINDDGTKTEDGIHLESGAIDCQIKDNCIYNTMGSGICLAADNLDCEISGNYVRNCDDYGIEVLDGCDRCMINNNKCYGNANHGIYLNANDYCTIVGNICNGNTGANTDGINLDGCDYCTISSNVCTANGDDGIVIVATSTKCIVIGNQLLGNTGAALTDGGTNTELGHNITV